MVVWSVLRPLLAQPTRSLINSAVTRNMSGNHRVLPFQPSRWQWQKFKDYTHFYLAIGIIPVTLLVTYVNVFIGPATLSEIPDGYEPKHWEYYRHPITRFIVRYMIPSPQQEYEKYLHHIFEEYEKMLLRKLEQKIKALLAERSDYQAYYYRPFMAKYPRMVRESADYIESIQGD